MPGLDTPTPSIVSDLNYSPCLKTLAIKRDGVYYITRAHTRIKGMTILYYNSTSSAPY